MKPFGGLCWPSAHAATVPGLWCRGLWDVRWDFVRDFSGASASLGPSRHRACVVVQSPRKCSLGSREEPLGGLPGISAVWRPLGGCFGASWGPLGLLGPLGGSLGLLGPPRSLLGRKGRFFGSRSPLWPLLARSWGPLGSWAFLGCFEALLGRLGAFLGRLRAF